MAIVATKTEEDVSTIVDRLDEVHQVFLDLCIFYDTISPIILTVLLFFFSSCRGFVGRLNLRGASYLLKLQYLK